MTKRLFAALASAALALPAAAQQRASSGQPERPTLVVFITVDQLRPDYFTRYEHQLNGGLARLRRGGAFFANGLQDHAVTETAPGHASTLSGRFPASTGIVANAYGVGDPQFALVGGGGAAASPFRFRGSTLIDWMRTADDRSRALSISRKDRGAILPLGRAKQHAYWYAYDGRFTTSRYYADTLPAWVARFNARQPALRLAGQRWTLLLPASAYPEPDSVPVEAAGRDYTFPHVLPSDSAGAVRNLPEFPWMDELTAELAVQGLRAMNLGRGPHTDLLAVSLSTTDAVGHRYGPDSREIHDQVLRLDRTLGAFIDSVYAQVDSSRVVFALTADHGVSSFPEVANPAEARSWHVYLDTLVAGMRAGVIAAGGDTAAVEFDDGLLFVRRERLPRGFDVQPMLRDFAARVRRVPGVARVDLMADLWAMDPATRERDDMARRWVHMIPRDQPIPLVVTLQPGRVWGTRTYAQHGSPHGYDARVPIIFYGPRFRPGGYDQAIRVVDMGPTLARVVGVMPTEALDGRVVEHALADH
jgi:predicted AlkP superfamily pyrophosphatase or phosphodiesterase